MRYPDAGGLSAKGRADREVVRLQAAAMFAEGVGATEVARRLRVTRKSATVWQRAWRNGGEAALVSKGPSGATCRLDEARLARLVAELQRGPAAHGWTDDQRWTLSRVADLIHRLFHVRYTPRGVSYLLHRLGWAPQAVDQRSMPGDGAALETRRCETWSVAKPVNGVRVNGNGVARHRVSR